MDQFDMVSLEQTGACCYRLHRRVGTRLYEEFHCGSNSTQRAFLDYLVQWLEPDGRRLL